MRPMSQLTRLHRSELCVPGSNIRMLEKAPGAGADVVMLDLEDAVAPDDKPQARLNVIDALREQDWSAVSVSLRINGLDTHYMYRDLVDVVDLPRRVMHELRRRPADHQVVVVRRAPHELADVADGVADPESEQVDEQLLARFDVGASHHDVSELARSGPAFSYAAGRALVQA